MAVSRRPLTAETRVRSWVSPCGIGGGQSGTGAGFSSNTSIFPCQFHSTGAPLQGKREKTHHYHLHHMLHNKPSRLRYFRSICCGALHRQKEMQSFVLMTIVGSYAPVRKVGVCKRRTH
jgi:hypothetical protein